MKKIKILSLLPILLLTSCNKRDYALFHVVTENGIIHYCTDDYWKNDEYIHIKYEKDKYCVTSIQNVYYWTNTQDCPICGYHAQEVQNVNEGIFGNEI